MNIWAQKLKILFVTVPRKIKYLIYRPCTGLVSQKLKKMLIKEIKEGANKWRDTPCSWTERQHSIDSNYLKTDPRI